MFDSLIIESPKRKITSQSRSKEFFPYYAGFPESFAESIIRSANLASNSVIMDPWNGSGTTTTAAMKLGYNALGIDINPVMVMVARARNLPVSSIPELVAEANAIFTECPDKRIEVGVEDPLLQWFDVYSTQMLRGIEYRVRNKLLESDLADQNQGLDRYSCLASNLYVALFSTCRNLTAPFRSSNPTWLKLPKSSDPKICVSARELSSQLRSQVENIATTLRISNLSETMPERSSIFLGDSTHLFKAEEIDLVLTSPPYCTRIDYTAATRVELAVIFPLLNRSREELSRDMVGSIKVPKTLIPPKESWGKMCNAFLNDLRTHTSKASSGYYYKTHIDYFDKLSRSLSMIGKSLKTGGGAIMVVQDSFYKELHNNVPQILQEMAAHEGMELRRREDFHQKNPISGINSKARKYGKPLGATESVLCFQKKPPQGVPYES